MWKRFLPTLPRRAGPLRKRPAVAGLGQCCLDHLCLVPAFPAPDSKCEFEEFLVQGGGPVATALVVLARWGVSTRFAGVVGDDDFGRKILDELVREGVDPSATVVRRGGRSQFAFVCVEKSTGRRTIFWGRPLGKPYQPAELPADFLDGVQALHLDGLHLGASLLLARKARDAGVPVVLDAGSLRPGMIALVRLSNCLIASERFFRQFRPCGSPQEALADLRKLGPQVVVITLGGRGCISLCGEKMSALPALRVRPRDTTGAGDVFHGAYIYAMLRGWPPPVCLRWATVSAGLSCTALGGRSGIPRRGNVRRRLRDLREITS